MEAPPAGGKEIVVRRAGPEDRRAILELCRASLGWRAEDPDEAFFSWKHDENPAGPSPSWIATDEDGRVVGLRVFLRWRFRDPSGGTLLGVRAVDTATHPDAQGRGIFRRLTLGALPELRSDGVDFVFNTPNDKSRPGYLKMGWTQVGRVPVMLRPTSPTSLLRTVRSRTAASLWSEDVAVGERAPEVFADGDEVAELLDRLPESQGISTLLTAEHLRWRYRFEPLHYRALLVGAHLRDGVVVVRFRRRGEALECAVCEVLCPPGSDPGPVLAAAARSSGADHMLACGGAAMLRHGFLPAPRMGPVLTWRPLCRTGRPRMADLDLSLGDVELF